MAIVVANYDGPIFIAVAKSLYRPEALSQFSFALPIEYYAAHFPLFPLLIRAFTPIFGSVYAMLFVTIASSLLAIYYFRKFIDDYVKKEDVLWMTIVFAIFPARWLIVRSVGSAEPLFIAAIVASLFYFKKEKYLMAGVWGAVAQLTKSPGILLFLAYILIAFSHNFKKIAHSSFSKWLRSSAMVSQLPLLLIPISLVGIFYFYKIQTNDFFAYFNSGDNIHLFFPPFQIFNYSQPWVGTFWLEEIIFVYLFGVLGLLRLIKKGEVEIATFVGVFFTSILFVSHRDIIRYSLPIVPFLMVAFSDVLIKREFKIAMAVLIIPIYLFSLTYISQNVMPISDWGPLL